MENNLTNKHLLLALLYSNGITQEINESIVGRTRIVKMIFLFDKEIKKKFLKDGVFVDIILPDFIPYNYGPFSKDIYNDLEFFINNDFVKNKFLQVEPPEVENEETEAWLNDFLFEDEKEVFSYSSNEEEFFLTQKGIDWVEEKLFKKLSETQKNLLREFKKRINSTSLQNILRYTYLQYPDYTTKSQIKGRVIGD